MEGQLKDSKEVDAPKLTDAKFIYYYSGIIGSDPSFKDGLKSKYLKSILWNFLMLFHNLISFYIFYLQSTTIKQKK